MPGILEGLSNGKAAASLGGRHGLSTAQQSQIQDLLVRHRDFIVGVFERGAASTAHVAASAIWLLAVPILAIFILRDGRKMANAIVEAVKSQGHQTRAQRILRQVDTMLARYIRAQLILAALSFAFYSVSMLVLRFPFAITLGILGGRCSGIPSSSGMARIGRCYSDGRLSDSLPLDMDGGIAGCVEIGAGLCELASYHG